jgi:hypothetical protein
MAVGVLPLKGNYVFLSMWGVRRRPVRASWLNQIEIYFSIVQRKVLTPNDFHDINAVAERLLNFQHPWETIAEPFQWKFSRRDLATLLNKIRATVAA